MLDAVSGAAVLADQLLELTLANNSLSGCLPAQLGQQLLALDTLDLSDNGIDGSLPAGEWTQLLFCCDHYVSAACAPP